MLVNLLQLTFSAYMLLIFDLVLTSYNLSTLWVITLAALVCLGALALLDWIRGRLMAVIGIEFEKQLAASVLSQSLADANLPESPQNRAALRDVQMLRNFMGGPQMFILLDLPWIPICLLIIFLMHPLPGVVGLCGGVISLVLGYLTDRASRRPLQEANYRNSMAGRFLETAVRNAPVVNAMGMNDDIADRWQQENDKVIFLQTTASLKTGLLQAIAKSYRQGLQVAIYGVGAYLAVTHQASAGIMVSSSIIIGKALGPVDQAMGAYRMLFEVRGAYARLKEMLDKPRPSLPMELPDPVGEIATENLSFAIQSRTIINSLFFRMPAGQSLALIGPSAAGKSTLCKLLLGIWQPSFGNVRIDGADLSSWDPERLGQFIGYLPQDVDLFPGTIAENIARLEHEPDFAKVVAAARMAGVHEMILSLPEGYQTHIQGQGYVLSGGQRQQIGLARALYGNPRVVVLDEPNSNLDSDGENALIQAILNMKKAKTTLVLVTHKMNILSVVDNIMFMRDGQVLLCGPREEVLQQMRAQQQQVQQQIQQQQDAARQSQDGAARQAPQPA